MLNVFIGFDPRQPVAAQVLADSIWKHASKPVSVTRLVLDTLPISRRGLTEFTYSRFLVPYLVGYSQEPAIFMDSDMLCRGDVHQLAALATTKAQVWVVKNKLRFEWPSMMVFRPFGCKKLTPEFINDTQNSLFDLAWASKIGALPAAWNHCVGYDKPNKKAKLVHFTQGIPIWTETVGCEYSSEWQEAAMKSNSSVSFQDLMGNSVHAKPVYERLKKSQLE